MTYSVFDIGADRPLFAANSNATTISDVVAVGFDLATTKAFVYRSGVVTILPLLSGSVQGTLVQAATPAYSVATSITADGTVVAGCCSDSGGVFRAVKWVYSGGSWSITQLAEPSAPLAGTLWTTWINYYDPGIGPVGAWVSNDGSQFVAMYAGTNDPGSPNCSIVGWDSVGAIGVTASIGSVVGGGCGPTPTSNIGSATEWGSSGSAAGTPFNFDAGVKHTPTTTLPGGHQVGLLSATATTPDGTKGVFTGTDLHSEVYVGIFYVGQTAGILNKLATPGGASNVGALGIETTAYWLCGGSDAGAVLWTAGVASVLPTLSGAAADQSYAAWGVSDGAAVLAGYGNNASGALRGIIWAPAGSAIPQDPACSNPTTQASFRASWTAVIGADTYNLRYRAAGTTPWTLVTGITDSFYSIPGLLTDTAYEWEVQSVTAGVESGWSTLTTCTTEGGCCVPTYTGVVQSGNITPGHLAVWVSDGVIADTGATPEGVLVIVAGVGLNGGTINAMGTISIDFTGTYDWTGPQTFGSTVAVAGGMEVGSPTGGMPSNGTINAEGVQVNGVAVISDFANANLSTLPTSDPGGNKPWRNGNYICVGS